MKALGIINFENSNANIEGLSEYRPVPAIAFMGRYRIIDFVLSNMTNSGISRVQVYLKEKPRNLIEHLGDGSHYNINSKRGKLRILYGEKTFTSAVYNHDVANFMLNMQYIEEDENPYVIIAPSYFVYSLDFSTVLQHHIESHADVTCLYYNASDAKEAFLGCDTIAMDRSKRITEFSTNRGKKKNAAISLEAYVMSKKLFIDLVKKAAATSSLYWFKDILKDSVDELDIRGYGIKGFVACINNLPEYFRYSMLLKDRGVASGLFKPGWPIYTQTNDSSPSKYTEGSSVKGSVVANGCVIEGNVKDSIISRNVTIRKGAIVKDSIILPGSYIGENAKLDHVIVDKYAIVHHIKELKGTNEAPVYVKRRDRI
ncbi:MAG: glucose-1-phosphate adenylyltransferase subunit GlgD [Solobacterium sp.]|jgi:glucose-1-phosphate adenylyltransferase|nr:glucose-1-phosphate adenylyltransferase subunit GlgD [Solobacterium sp.]MCH4205784.1 glucose-1-phosphate adenylyltransferase subunit GlgD [Solobacterium sp.]MCH4227308.1 glucose-1-phosphate adenylyltransferase subunit GlgD [Solobacterium sp.]